MAYPLADAYAAIWSRLATESAGSAVRALLPGGVLTAAALEAGPVGLPDPPFVVWREGIDTAESGEMGDAFGAWWIYVPRADLRLLAQVAEAIRDLYPRFCVNGGRITAGPLGQPAPDRSLGLYTAPLTVRWRRLA